MDTLSDMDVDGRSTLDNLVEVVSEVLCNDVVSIDEVTCWSSSGAPPQALASALIHTAVIAVLVSAFSLRPTTLRRMAHLMHRRRTSVDMCEVPMVRLPHRCNRTIGSFVPYLIGHSAACDDQTENDVVGA